MKRDLRFHFFRRQSRRFGQHGDGGPIEIRENIRRELGRRKETVGGKQYGRRENQHAAVESESDDGVEH